MLYQGYLEMLTDEDVSYMLKDPNNFDSLLAPIKKAKPHSPYREFDKYLGTKDKKSNLVQKYLPKIALELYTDRDPVYVKIVQGIAEKSEIVLQATYEELYGEEFSAERLESFKKEDYIDFIKRYEKEPNRHIDLGLFWIQLKLCGIDIEEETKKEIATELGLSPSEEGDKEIEDNILQASEEQATEEKKKITKSSKKGSSAAEKEAKRKEAELLRKKEEKEKLQKEIEEKVEEESEEHEETFKEEIQSENKPEPSENKSMNNMESKQMHAFVGTVNIKTGPNNLDFLNFNPMGELNGKDYRPFQEYELEYLFPESDLRNLLLYYTADQYSVVSSKIEDGMLLILEYEVDEMEANLSTVTGERNRTGYKVKFIEGLKNKRIRYMWEDGFYKIKSSDILRDSFGSKKTLRIEDDGLMDEEEFLLELDNGTIVGPFKASYKPTLEGYVIEADVEKKNYLLDGYSKSSLVSTCFERIFFKGQVTYFQEYYVSIPEGVKPKLVDVITDKTLLEAFSAELKIRGESSVDINNLPSYINNVNSNTFVGEGVPEDIAKARYDRVVRLLSVAAEDQEAHDAILDVICDVFAKSKDNEKVEELIKELLTRDSFVENIQSIKFLKDQIEALKDERDSLEEKKKDEQFEKEFDERRKKEEIRLSADYQKKTEELEKLEKRIAELKESEKLNKTHEQLEEDVTYLTKHKENLSRDVKDLELSFTKMINDSSAKMADVTFDGFVSSKMIEAASKWDDDERAKTHEALVEAMNHIPVSEISDEDLIDYLVRMIQITRPHYTRNMIINLMICSMQGMLTVFSGPPGCGKTSICNIISKVLGTRNQEKVEVNGIPVKPNRFIQVSVERGWTSKRDFIGYYNPLTKTFEENNHEVFDGLKLLNTETRKGIHGLPFIILLDEANLSPMEYYWADFMNVCDDLENNHSVNLGNNNIFEIPETLHFLATINNDHTTETLSPRLIDRAWVVTLPQEKSYLPGKEIPEEEIQTVAWDNLKRLFVECDEQDLEFSRDAQVIYDEIKKRLSDIGPALSIRTDRLIRRYCAVASKLMEENVEVGYSSEIVALDYAISQKVLPKLSGNGDEFETWLIDFRDYAKKCYLNNTATIINRILEVGKRQMKFYQFFN